MNTELYKMILMNDVVLRNLFTLLTFDELKTCRLVCHKWKNVGSSFFKKQALICFDFHDSVKNGKMIPSSKQILENLKQIFTVSGETMPFDSLQLSNRLPWSTIDLANFFSVEGKLITALTLFDVIVTMNLNQQNNLKHSYDLAPLIGGIVHLKHLKVQRDYKNIKNTTQFTLNLSQLIKIQTLDIERCTIELTNDILKPIELHLKHVAFVRNGIFVENVLINDFVDFGVIGSFSCDCHNLECTQIKLHLNGNTKINDLTLKGVVLINKEKSAWTIKSLALCRVPLTTQCYNMNFKQLEISFTECNMGSIPQSVEDLNIGFDVKILDCNILSPCLSNLRNLSIQDKTSMEIFLPRLKLFKNLVQLKLERWSLTRKVIVDVNNIPKSVKRIFLTSTGFEFVGHKKIHVDTLVLVSCNSEFVDRVTHLIEPKFTILQ